MKYLLFILILAFTSCNVAKKVFRHKDKSIIQVKTDSTGQIDTHVDTSKTSSLRTVASTDIIQQGSDAKGSGIVDLDQLRLSAKKGKALVIPLLDSLGNVVGSLSTVFDPVNNQLKQTSKMKTPPVNIHNQTQSSGQQEQKGITDQNQKATVNKDNKQKNQNQDIGKEVKRSPAWVKWILVISGVILVLLAVFNRGKIWKWIKGKLIKK